MRSKYIDKKTVEKLRGAMDASEWLPLRISLETGLRIGDVVSLKCADVKRSNGRGDTPRFFIRAKAKKTGKTGDFAISEALFRKLKARESALVAKGGDKKTQMIFPSYGKTQHLTRQAAWSRMKRAAHKLGIPADGISPHSLRKSFAVALMHERGITAVKEALQHSSTAVTRIYAYADTILKFDSDEPIRWRDVELIVEYILERLRET